MEKDSIARWDTCHGFHGSEAKQFWRTHLKGRSRKLLYVLGSGFDPRMCSGVEKLLGQMENSDVTWLCIGLKEEYPEPALVQQAKENNQHLLRLLGDNALIQRVEIDTWHQTGISRKRATSRNTMKGLRNQLNIEAYDDIVVDISSMAQAVYFTLLGFILSKLDRSKAVPTNLHIIALEDPELDRLVVQTGIDESASYIRGFAGQMQTAGLADVPLLWIPVLGEGERVQLERLYDFVKPVEICPVLPFPSRDPRRRDKLIVEYHDLLMDQWQIEPKNFVFASERNPFDVYIQLRRLVQRYDDVLRPIEGCKAVISSQSSKVLSIGAFLAAYELKNDLNFNVGIVHIESQGYGFDFSQQPNGELFSIWVAGECYGNE